MFLPFVKKAQLLNPFWHSKSNYCGGEKKRPTSTHIGKRHLKSSAPEGSGVWVLYLCPATHGHILHFEISSKKLHGF